MKNVNNWFTFCGIILFLFIFSFFLHNKLSVNKNDLMVMFFRESIQGLKVGSPVVFRGVEVGKVVKIDLEFNKENYKDVEKMEHMYSWTYTP